jgi:hypothetical protein
MYILIILNDLVFLQVEAFFNTLLVSDAKSYFIHFGPRWAAFSPQRLPPLQGCALFAPPFVGESS